MNILKLWLSSWKSVPSDAAAAAELIGRTAVAGTGSRLFSLINSVVSSGSMGIMMLSMTVTTMLSAASITYDIFVNEDSPLQVQEAEFDTGVITDEEGNFLPIVYTDEHGNVVASTEFAHSAQTGQGLSLMDLMQAIAEPDEVFTAYEPWVPDEQWMVDSGLWTEDEVRTLFVSLDLPPPVFNDTSREVSLNIPDASDTPNEIITPEVTTATPEITTTPEVTITEPVVGDDDSVVPEVTTTTPEVTTTTPEVTTTAPEVTTTAPEVTTTTPAITTTTAPPLTTTTTAPITTTTSPPTTTTTSPPRPPVTTAPPQLAQESLTLTAPNDITAFTFGQAPIQLEQGGGSGTGAVTYTSSDTNIITISNSGFVSFERVGTATITVTKAASGNYLAASAELELTVTKRDLSLLQIGAIPAVIYSGFPHTPLPTLTDGGLITAADYTLSYSNNVSTGTATVTITAADSGNYTGSRAVSFTINKAEPNYILPTGLTAVYGDLLSDIALPEGWAWVSPSASVGNAGARSHSATFTHIDTDNFNAITRSISVTVAKAETDYILPTGLTATYGDLLSSVALPAGWAWDSPSSTVGNAGSRSHSATFTPQDSVNFNLVTRSVSITIARAEPNVTPPTGLSAAFGELLSDVALPSGWAWDSPADSVGGIGTRSFSATYTPDDIANFTIIETDLNLTVNPASPSAPNMPTEASQTSTSVTLAAPSGANPLFALEYGMNTTNSPPVSWQDSLVFTGLAESGTYFFFARYKADPDRNYASAASVALEISPQKIAQAPLTVTGAPATITFGDLAFTLIVSGGSGTGGITFASSDTSVVSVDSMSGFVMIEGAGTATITVTKASDDIYNARSEEVPIVIAQGTLTGTPTAADITTYGGLLSTSAITGAVHSQHSVPIAGAWNWNTPTVIPAYGTTQYTATFTPTSPVNQAGYETLSATINVTVLNKADPDYTLPTGLSAFYGELLSSVTLPTGWAWASPTTAVGNVATSPNTHSATFTPDDTDNYNVLTRDVSVAIAKAAQTLTLTAPGDITTFAYGHAQVQLTRSNGLGTGAYSFSSSDTDVITVSNTGFVSFERAGAATITVTKAECENYLAASAEITLTVGKIAPTLLDLTFALTSVTYDGTQQSISVTSTASGIGAITVLYDGSPTVPINADTYEISANIAEGDNYTAVTLTLGDFIISPRTLTITATGTLSPIDPVTLTITGVIGSDTVPLTTPDFAVTGTTMTIHVASTVPNVANQIPFTTTNTNYTIPNTTAVNIRDGRAAGREIPVTQANIAQFNTFARGLDGRGRHYILTENVTLSGTWTPIGSFGGGFDGDGYTISNLTINAITLDQGMFSSIAVGGVVKNLGLVNVNITSTTNWVGGVAASSG
ncbi:MAG: MBG domain-containing protein, partial [Oscillospiraceae bacterium]|nr:MBG domain-containing protein [Oscillospiraceae bacterium]